MTGIENIATAPMWAGFVAFVLLMLAVDLWIFGGNKHTRSAHAKRPPGRSAGSAWRWRLTAACGGI
jgi:hypothetical protein